MSLSRFLAAVILVLLPFGSIVFGQQTVGLFQNDPGSFDGYTLFGTLTTGPTFLIDNEGKLVHEWFSAFPTGNTVYLLPGGSLLRAGRFDPVPGGRFNAGGAGGRIERFDWDGTILWDFVYSTDTFRHHHDIAPLPNGNVLLIVWELKTSAEAIAAGRSPGLLPEGELWPEQIVEVEPVGATGGTIVWEWSVWDHLIQDFDPTKDNFGVVADHPELVDVNFLNGGSGGADWLHANAVDYDPDRDEIILGTPFLAEVWVIDHSTTTEEAAGHTGGNAGKGGDLLYRWGNPQAYGRGIEADRKLFNQHDTEWIDAGLDGAGNILVFNNGVGRPAGDFSSVDEIVPPRDETGAYVLAPNAAYGPADPIWTYTANPPTDFFAAFLSSAQRLPNGNTLIDDGPAGNFFEVTSAGETVWRYVNPVSVTGPIPQGSVPANNRAFRAERYAPDYPGLVGQDLTPGDPLELFDAPVPAPDGTNATVPLSASKLDTAGSQIRIRWDTASCVSLDYNLLYGALGEVASYELMGSECAIGSIGTFDWLAVPASDLYFLIVGVDGTGVYESSWGFDSSGNERNGTMPSTLCTATNKIISESCP